MSVIEQTMTPDTCEGFEQNKGCKFTYAFDPTLPAAKQTLTPVSVERRCSRHSSLDYPTLDSVFTEARENEVRKNKLVQRMQIVHPEWFDPDSGELIDCTWSFDVGGTLRFSTPPGTGSAKKNALQSWVNGNLGIKSAVIS